MIRYAATRMGTLPGTENVILRGMALPRGKRIVADPSYGTAPSTEPVLWITEQPVARVSSTWRDLAEGFTETGLWPLVLSSLDRADARPWLDGELAPSRTTDPKHFDAASVLAEKWQDGVPVPEEDEDAMLVVAPFGREFPGLAATPAGENNGEALDLTAAELEGRLGLVAVQRPADAVAVLGWMGPTNADLDIGALAAVLRSWEDRFGAYVVGIGFDTLVLGVQRPPTTMKEALAIAAEHFAICSDNVHQGAGSVEAYAEEIIEQYAWRFWWD